MENNDPNINNIHNNSSNSSEFHCINSIYNPNEHLDNQNNNNQNPESEIVENNYKEFLQSFLQKEKNVNKIEMVHSAKHILDIKSELDNDFSNILNNFFTNSDIKIFNLIKPKMTQMNVGNTSTPKDMTMELDS